MRGARAAQTWQVSWRLAAAVVEVVAVITLIPMDIPAEAFRPFLQQSLVCRVAPSEDPHMPRRTESAEYWGTGNEL